MMKYRLGEEIFHSGVLYATKSWPLQIFFELHDILGGMRYFTVYHYLVWICAAYHPSCGEQSLSINAGTMLRECIKIRSIHQLLLSRPSLIEPLFTQYAFDPNFDVCSDVFQSIRELLRKNKQIVSSALRPSKPLYNQLFSWIYALLESENYVITRIVLHVQNESNRLTNSCLGNF